MNKQKNDRPAASLGAMESRFADIIWGSAPLPSGELVKLCREELGWQKSTTYTMLRRLCQKGLFQNQDGLVSALLSKEEFLARQSEDFLESNFAGSLPRFLAAFSSRQRLSEADVAELEQLIASAREAGGEEQ